MPARCIIATSAELLILITAKDTAGKVLDGLGKSLGGFGAAGKVASAAMAGFAVAGAGVAVGIGKSITAAADFEHSIASVGALANASAAQMQQLSEEALRLGQSASLSGIGASDAAAAMQALAAAGFTVDEMTHGVTEGVLLLASATGSTVTQAATIAGDAFGEFRKSMGLTAADMPRIANLFTGAANVSSISLGDIGEAMKSIGPVASSMGISIEEVTAAVAALGNQGIKGGAAGTALRGILTSLVDPSKESAKLIRDLGLNFRDAQGNMKDFGGIAEELRTKMAGLTQAQKEHTIAQLFDSANMPAILALMSEGAKGVDEYAKKIAEQGNAAAAGAARNNNLAGSWQALGGIGETASIKIGRLFTPMLKTWVDAAVKAGQAALPLIDAWGPRFIASIQSGIGRAVAIVQSFGLAVMAMVNSLRSGDFSNLFGPLITAISTAFGSETAGKVTLFISNLVTGLNLARDAVLTAKQAFAGDWVSADSIATPVRLIGELFLMLGNAMRTVQGIIAQIPTPVLAAAAAFLALGPALSIVGAILPTLIGALTGLGPIVGILTSSIPLLGSVIAALGGPITLAIVAVGLLAAAWTTDFMGIQTATMPVITAIGAMITGTLLPALMQAGTFITTTVVPAFVAGWAMVSQAVSNAVTAVTPAVQQFVGFLTGSLIPGIQGIVAVAGPAFEQMKTAAVGAFQAALPGIQSFIGGVQQLGAAAMPIITQVAGVIVNSLGPAVMAMVGWAQTVIPQFAAAFTNVMSIVGPVIGALADLIGTGLGAIAGFVSAHSEQITTALTAAWNIISATIGAVFAIITGIISAGLQLISGDFEGAWKTIQSTTTSVWSSIQTIITSAMTIISTAISVGAALAGSIISAAWASIQSVTSSAWAAVVAAVTTAMGNLKTAIANGIAQAGTAIATGVAKFPGMVLSIGGAMFSAGASIIKMLAAGIDSAIGAAVKKVQDGLDLIKNLLPHSEPKDPNSPLRGLVESGRTIFTMLGVGISQGAPEAVKAAAEAASSVAKAITDGLSALTALSAFKGGPTGGQVSGFLASLSDFMEKFTTWAGGWEEDVLKAAQTFASATSAAVGVIKGGVEGLQLISTFTAPIGSAVSGFLASVADFMEKFSTVAGGFEDDVLATSNAFADGVGKAVGVLSGAVSGLMALANFKAPLESIVSTFLASLADFMERFSTVAGGFEADVLAVASTFAEGVGKAVGVLGAGVTGLMALADFTAPLGTVVSAFLASLADFMEKFSTAAGGFESDMLAHSALFADTVGKVIAIIGRGVEGFTKLLTFVAPSQQAIDNFVYAVFEAVRKIAEMAGQMSTEGIKLAGDFGAAANGVLGALKTGLDVFTGLAKLVVPSAKAIDDFAIAIAYTVGRIGTIADQLGRDGIKRAADFGASVQTIFGSLKSSMDILSNLEKFKDVAAKAFDSLLAGLVGAKERAEGMVSQAKDLVLLSEEYLANMSKAAANFAKGQSLGGVSGEEIGRSLGEGVASGAREALDSHSPSQVMASIGRDVVAGLVQGMDDAQQDAAKKAADVASAVSKAIQDTLGAATALGKLDVATLPGAGQITGILAFTRALVAEMAASATMLNEDGTKATSAFADAAGKVASAVSAGVGALTSLVTFVAPARSAVFDFGKTLRLAVNDLTVLAEEIGVELAEKAALFSEQATKAIAIFGSGVGGFTSLIGYVRPAAKAIYDFGKDLMLALGDLAAIVDEIGQELADKAGKFGEMASKAVAVIGGGAESFTKLKEYTRIPSKAIYDFGKDLMALIGDFAAIVDLIGVEVANKAGQFADGAGKAVTVVGTALGSFSGLATFVTPGRAAVDGLLSTVRYIIARFGEMAQTMSSEGTKQLGDFGAATNAVLGGVKAAIDTFIALDKAVVPQTGDLSDLVVAVQGVTRNMAAAAAALGDDAIKDATAFGTAAQGIFTALKSGLDLFIQIDKPGNWPATDWLQPLIELMRGVLARGGQLLSQSQELKAIADQFSANLMQAGATFGGALGLGDMALTGNIGGSGLIGGGGGGGTVVNNYYTVTGNTLLSKDTSTQQMVSGIVTTQQGRAVGYSVGG